MWRARGVQRLGYTTLSPKWAPRAARFMANAETATSTDCTTISIVLNGRKTTISGPDGRLALEAAREAGIGIPTLCYYPNVANHRAVCR